MDVINTAINIVILVEPKRVSPHSPRMAILRKIRPIDIIKLGKAQLKHDSSMIHICALHEENEHIYHSDIEWYMDGFLSNALYSVLIVGLSQSPLVKTN